MLPIVLMKQHTFLYEAVGIVCIFLSCCFFSRVIRWFVVVRSVVRSCSCHCSAWRRILEALCVWLCCFYKGCVKFLESSFTLCGVIDFRFAFRCSLPCCRLNPDHIHHKEVCTCVLLLLLMQVRDWPCTCVCVCLLLVVVSYNKYRCFACCSFSVCCGVSCLLPKKHVDQQIRSIGLLFALFLLSVSRWLCLF